MTIRLPNFITFTGIDDSTAVSDLRMVRDRYPVEFGILLSRDRQGKHSRYPNNNSVRRFMGEGLSIAVHLCGAYAREVMDFPYNYWEIPTHGAHRVQINTRTPNVAAAQRFSQMIGKRVILQARGANFPPEYDVDWLHDESGGTGAFPKDLPLHDGRLLGYAGGIGPDNVMQAIERINSGARSWMPTPPIDWAIGPYWIDMESGVRDENDQFSIKKVWAVCETVYGRKL